MGNTLISSFIVMGVLFGILNVFVFEKQDAREIKENLGITYGEVTKVLRGGYKGGVLTAYFRYTVDNVSYEFSRPVSSRKVWGNRFPVVYSKINPVISRILIEADDFKEFDLAFPDSLR